MSSKDISYHLYTMVCFIDVIVGYFVTFLDITFQCHPMQNLVKISAPPAAVLPKIAKPYFAFHWIQLKVIMAIV